MGVGSGERITSGINRHTKILNQGFELVHELGLDLGVLVFRLWLLYEPGEHRSLSETEITRIKNGAYIRHSDSAYDLGIGDGDDNLSVFCSLNVPLIGAASERMVAIHRKCYKIIEPAFTEEFQNACEILSRVHVPRLNIHFPLPSKWLQKILLCYINCDFDTTSQHVRLGGADYAQVATALIQRVYAARQLPLLRWLGLSLAELYADLARSKGWQTSVYTDDDRRKGLEDGDFVLQAMCEDLREWLQGAVIDFDAVVEVLSDGKPHAADLGHRLGMTDAEWAQMTVTREMVFHRDIFERNFPVSRDIRTLLGITEWAAPDPDKLVKLAGDGPSPVSGNATSLGEPRRSCAGLSTDGHQSAPLAEGVAKPGSTMGRGASTVTDAEGIPAGTCHDSVACVHRGSDAKTTVMATVPTSTAGDMGPSGAMVVCGGGTPGPAEPLEVQPQAQKVLLSEVLPHTPATDSRDCQIPTPVPLLRTSAVGGLTDMLAGSPQSSAPETTHHAASKSASCVRYVAPGSNQEEWHQSVLLHLRTHGQKTAEQLIAEGVLPIIKQNDKVASGKRRKFANQTLTGMQKRGLVGCDASRPSQLPVWFAVAAPPGL
jgi:hypothetical protein